MADAARFEQAQKDVKTLTRKPSNDDLTSSRAAAAM